MGMVKIGPGRPARADLWLRVLYDGDPEYIKLYPPHESQW
jgi:hypothetical protein